MSRFGYILILQLTVTLVWPSGAHAGGIRIFENPQNALAEARATCQPIVIHFYDDLTMTRVSRNMRVSAQDRIRLFYLDSKKIREESLKEAVVLILPMGRWSEEARNLGVTTNEGLASLSPFELQTVDGSCKWGGLVFR
jgi:hypothetical protein